MTDTGRQAVPFGKFEWDERKRKENLDRHGIDFEDAARLFDNLFFKSGPIAAMKFVTWPWGYSMVSR